MIILPYRKGKAPHGYPPHLAPVPVEDTSSLPVSRQVHQLVDASIAPNMKRAYRHALKKFDEVVAGWPVTDEVVANYLAGLFADEEKSPAPATCAQIVAAIKFRAKLNGAPAPTGPATDRVLAGIRRQGRGRGQGQGQGVNFSQADAAAAVAAGDGSLHGLRDAALIAVMSDGLLRISELAALEVSDLSFEPEGDGRATVRRSKTDQEGVGVVLFLGPPTVLRIKAWMEAAGIDDGPLFRRVYRGERNTVGTTPLSTVSVRTIIQRRCADSGGAPIRGLEGSVSGHSLRVGGAQSLAAGGASLAEMQTAGRWESPSMPGHYARGQLAARGAVARIRYDK